MFVRFLNTPLQVLVHYVGSVRIQSFPGQYIVNSFNGLSEKSMKLDICSEMFYKITSLKFHSTKEILNGKLHHFSSVSLSSQERNCNGVCFSDITEIMSPVLSIKFDAILRKKFFLKKRNPSESIFPWFQNDSMARDAFRTLSNTQDAVFCRNS